MRHARDVGRLCFDDHEVAHACVGGSVLAVLHLGLAAGDPDRIDRAADRLRAADVPWERAPRVSPAGASRPRPGSGSRVFHGGGA